jgi:hypothetical protein
MRQDIICMASSLLRAIAYRHLQCRRQYRNHVAGIQPSNCSSRLPLRSVICSGVIDHSRKSTCHRSVLPSHSTCLKVFAQAVAASRHFHSRLRTMPCRSARRLRRQRQYRV